MKKLQAFTLAKLPTKFPPFLGRVRVGNKQYPSQPPLTRGGVLAFTLAEVLITLGIIGVVSAITMPSLIKSYQKKAASTRIKADYSILMQAIQRSEVDNNELKTWDFSKTTDDFAKTYFEPYFKGLKRSSVQDGCYGISRNDARYLLPNGSCLAILNSNGNLYVSIDINAKQLPNKWGSDKFYFTTTADMRLMPHGWVDGITREQAKNGYNYHGTAYSCKASPIHDNAQEKTRYGCFSLLMLDGWEMKDDYPY